VEDICLIIPPAKFLGDPKRNTPLGVLYVASYLEKNGVSVKLADLRDNGDGRVPKSRYYGITATTPEYDGAVRIAKRLKDSHDCVIVLGGPHATAVPDDIDEAFDYVVTGEGESAALSILKGQERNRRVLHSLIDNLDEIPFPARKLLNRSSIVSSSLGQKGILSTTMIASRGCAYDCAYCSSKSMWQRRVRYRSPENVTDEIKELIRVYHVYSYRFHDDTMTVSRKWITDFCDAIHRNNLKIQWRTNTRTNHSGFHMFQMMRKAGCYDIGFGIEDPREHIQRINNKQISGGKAYTEIENARRAGIKSRVFLMIGLPGQGTDTADAMIEYIEEAQPDYVDLSTFVPYPGTDIYNNPGKYGIRIKSASYDDYVFALGLHGNEADADFLYQHDVMTNEELKEQRRRILTYISERKMVVNA